MVRKAAAEAAAVRSTGDGVGMDSSGCAVADGRCERQQERALLRSGEVIARVAAAMVRIVWLPVSATYTTLSPSPRSRGEPSATYVDARRASDGLDVDRAACVQALKR